MAANTPPVRALDGVRKDAPAVAAPEHADRAKHTSEVIDVEDVGVAVVQENTVFTVLLLLHEGEHLRQGGFSFRFATELSDDWTVHRGLPQLVVTERSLANRVFGFTLARHEPSGEVVAEVADLDLGFAASVTNEILFGDELPRGCRDRDCRDELENRGCGFRFRHLCYLTVTPTGFFVEELLQFLFPPIAILATEVHDELIERSVVNSRSALLSVVFMVSFLFFDFLYAEEALLVGVVIARNGLCLSHFSL